MATHLSSLLKTTPPWLASEGEMGDIALASLGRLVRNLPGQPFPGWSTAESRRTVVDTLLPLLLARPGYKSAFHADLGELKLEQRRLLLERKLITPCMAARQDGCHVIIPRKQDVSIMLNEEEHLVAHFFQQGLCLRNVLTDMQRMAASLEKDIPFAHDALHGYLSSLPAEAGDGMQLYVVLHLPALVMANMLDQITRGLEKLQINLAPFHHGMEGDTGNIFVLFTNAIPQGKAKEVMEDFEDAVHTLIVREIQVRAKLKVMSPFDLADQLGRAFGLLCYAVRLSYQEMLDSLSLIRMGSRCGLLSWELPTEEVLGRLAALNVELAPAHLAQAADKHELPELHPVLRAMRVKEVIMDSCPTFDSPITP